MADVAKADVTAALTWIQRNPRTWGLICLATGFILGVVTNVL